MREPRPEIPPKAPLIREVRREGEVDGYEEVTLIVGRGEIACRYYPVSGAYIGAIWVGGVGGDWDTPASDLYPRLCEELKNDNIASLRVCFRYPTALDEAVYDVMAGVSFLEMEGIAKMALIGHSFGGAVAIQSAARSEAVKTVITLSTQSQGADLVSELSPDCSILLIHGEKDKVLPPDSSRVVYGMAHEPKKLIILQGNGHSLDKSADKVRELIYDWIVLRLEPPKSS